MGLAESLRRLVHHDPYQRREGGRVLDVPSGDNVRELGGYDTARGATLYHRFLRSGTTAYLSKADITYLLEYGVRAVLDLRSPFEDPRATDRLARVPEIEGCNVPLFDYDLSDPTLTANKRQGNYLVDGYLTMLANRPAIREIFAFFAAAPEDACVLFHCAAGMDRTGMTALLLLGLAGVGRTQVVADYLYSFDDVRTVDRLMAGEDVAGRSWASLDARRDAVETVYDALVSGYGTVHDYLQVCGVSEADIARVRARLVAAAPNEQVAPGAPRQ